MIGGSVAYYPFPDDNSRTLHRVLSELTVADRRAITWQPTLDWLLEASPDVAEDISDTFSDAGVRQLDPDWKSGAVLVPDHIRSAVEGCLEERDGSAKWSQVEGVEFATERSRRAFEALIDHAASDCGPDAR